METKDLSPIKYVGFWGEIYGMESMLFEAQPVWKINGETVLATSLSWGLRGTGGVTPADLDYVSRFNEPVIGPFGATVWMAGPEFVNLLKRVTDAGHRFEWALDTFMSWPALANGFRYHVGPHGTYIGNYNLLASCIDVELEENLTAKLWDDSVELNTDLYKLYVSLGGVSPVDYLIHKGVWLKVAGEEKQYEFLREEAVVCHKEFRDVRYFDLKVSDEIIRLKSWLVMTSGQSVARWIYD